MKFEDLNDEQKVAVAFPDNLLLTACPGSGKTRVTTHKVAWEIENATSPRQKLAALTYTIRAAEEIERRLEQDNIDPKMGSGKMDQSFTSRKDNESGLVVHITENLRHHGNSRQ